MNIQTSTTIEVYRDVDESGDGIIELIKEIGIPLVFHVIKRRVRYDKESEDRCSLEGCFQAYMRIKRRHRK